MKYRVVQKEHVLFFLSCIMFWHCEAHSSAVSKKNESPAAWTVIGAGPVGIAAVGLIIESGISPHAITWVDPEFNVGRMGKYYRNVPGNSTVLQYITFLKTCTIFGKIQSKALDHLLNMPLSNTPPLKFIVEPLQDITHYLRNKVRTFKDEMIALDFDNDEWHIQTNNIHFVSENVVLATGAHPKTMHYQGIPEIPLDFALDKETLATYVKPTDTVAVIGSSHSAMLIVKYLTELSVHSIINFYNKPLTYPTPLRTGVAWKESGLKGEVALWTKTVLERHKAENVVRVEYDSELFKTLLSTCTKVICAIGFERNELPPINGDVSVYANYDVNSGMIKPHLFGLGIAFPQQQIDPLGNPEYLVGLPYLTFDALRAALDIK